MDPLFLQLRERLEQRPGTLLSLPGVALRESAVLVPLLHREGEPRLVFTKRPVTLRTHAGQISFPGGGRDSGDATPLHTALRETHEELGIPQEQVTVLGMLDEVPTITRYRILPFVGVIPDGFPYLTSVAEVEEVVEVPVRHFLDPSRLRTERRFIDDLEREIHFYDYGRHTIWGATARIVRDLLTRSQDLPAFTSLVSNR